MMLRTIIIDDVKYIRVELKAMLNKYPAIKVVGEASNGKEAMDLINKLKPNLIFLDIQMPVLSGLDLLKQVKIDFKIIFISSYSKHLSETKKFNAVGFLMKPINYKKLDSTLKKIIH